MRIEFQQRHALCFTDRFRAYDLEMFRCNVETLRQSTAEQPFVRKETDRRLQVLELLVTLDGGAILARSGEKESS
jgi:hypothetical protein